MVKSGATACVVLLGMLGVRAVAAQNSKQLVSKAVGRSLLIGPVANVSFMTFYGDNVSASSVTRFSVGAAMTLPIGPSAFFQPQLLYATKGAQNSSGGVTGEVNPSYIELPLLFGLHLSSDRTRAQPYLLAGPYVALLTSCKVKVRSGGVSAELNCDDSSVGLTTNSTDIGLTAGAGVDIPMGRGALTIAARFELGFSKVTTQGTAKNRGFTIGLGYLFNVAH